MHSTAKVIPFAFESHEVRTLLIDGQPWFVASDVCDALAIANSRRALSRLDEDEKGVHSMNTLGGTQNLGVLNESGLYSLILTSRKAEAKRFKKWVTAEVLPAIRKHGYYADSDRKMSTLLGQTIGTNGFNILGAIIKGKVSRLPVPTRRSATSKLWSQLHAAYGVRSAEDIPADQLDSARTFVAAYAIDGEYLPANDPSMTPITDEQLYSIWRLKRHFLNLHNTFNQHNLYTHLTGLGSRAGIEMRDQFCAGKTAAVALSELDDGMESVQRRLGVNGYA
jgi:hypothetical protein